MLHHANATQVKRIWTKVAAQQATYTVALAAYLLVAVTTPPRSDTIPPRRLFCVTLE